MDTIKGDLVEMARRGEFDVIVHGCNCFCAMGAGIAKAIKAAFPEAYAADCQTTPGDREKLGAMSYATVQVGMRTLTVVNAYTQYHWQGEGVLADYQAITRAFAAIKETFAGKYIAYPKIGAGLAGGDWSIISAIIDEALAGERHCVVVCHGAASKD